MAISNCYKSIYNGKDPPSTYIYIYIYIYSCVFHVTIYRYRDDLLCCALVRFANVHPSARLQLESTVRTSSICVKSSPGTTVDGLTEVKLYRLNELFRGPRRKDLRIVPTIKPMCKGVQNFQSNWQCSLRSKPPGSRGHGLQGCEHLVRTNPSFQLVAASGTRRKCTRTYRCTIDVPELTFFDAHWVAIAPCGPKSKIMHPNISRQLFWWHLITKKVFWRRATKIKQR